eukprot:TRINITY_DN24293_c0_g2_i2.p1 TRINITY_DN24293_c0_g2~~TRINITY_DN24293_c0_g2_i2.p1  ORF type:complete len:488 (+),score=79.53 TRINITY_DN24293_c0_g2_i2:248-1711(+)
MPRLGRLPLVGSPPPAPAVPRNAKEEEWSFPRPTRLEHAGKPKERPPRKRAKWCKRHYVLPSLGNSMMPKCKRVYFDEPSAILPYFVPQSDIAFPDASLEAARERHRGVFRGEEKKSLSEAKHNENSEAPKSIAGSHEHRALSEGDEAGDRVEAEEVEADDGPVEAVNTRKSKGRSLVLKRLRTGDTLSSSPDFNRWCLENYGYFIRVWRLLDPAGNMSLRRSDFLKGLKSLGFQGDLKKLWLEFDKENTGVISLFQFAPESAAQLAQFKHWIEIKFGSFQDAFRALDLNKSGKLTPEEVEIGCRQHDILQRLEPAMKTFFNLMMSPQTAQAVRGGILVTEIAFLDAWKPPDYLWQVPAKPEDLQLFRSTILAKYLGNPLIAWRKLLDRGDLYYMKTSYSEFIGACKQLVAAKEVLPSCEFSELYCALDRQRRGYLLLVDWDERCYDILTRFTTWNLEGRNLRAAGAVEARWRGSREAEQGVPADRG